MKFQSLALPLLALLPVCAQAQTQNLPIAPTAASVSSMDPEAKALLDRATATYETAAGLRLRSVSAVNGKEAGAIYVAFSGPKLFLAERQSGPNKLRLLLNKDGFYIVQGKSYSKTKAPAGGSTELMGTIGSTGSEMIASMLMGKDPVMAMLSQYTKDPFIGLKNKTVVLPPQVLDGDVYKGVQSNFSFSMKGRDGGTHAYGNQVTAWFGGVPFALRRVQTRYTVDGRSITLGERIFDQEVNPTFADDTFKFDGSGLKLIDEPNEDYWDPRIQVGNKAFSFQGKDLKGQTISLAKYKGKVVLLDFWATWCGPCVASMPEVKSAYDRYKGLEVIGVPLDEDKNTLVSFIKQRKLAWPQIYDGKGWDSAVPSIYGIKALPLMLIIGKDGKVSAVNPHGRVDAAVRAAFASS